MKIAVVGATGLVGSLMLKVLEERGFAQEEILVAASVKSVGKKIKFSNRELIVQSVEEVIEQECDYAIFSAGGATSKKYAPLFAAKGTIVIDNSSAWRMQENIPLVVPEINASAIKPDDKIISNPNCSTIQMVLALSLLHKEYQIKRIVVLWLEVLFYSVLFYFISLSFNYDKFSYKGFLRVLMPVLY